MKNVSEYILRGAAGLSAGGLMVMTGIHSYGLLVQTLPKQQHDMAIVGLLALEGGFLLWSFAFVHSHRQAKKALAGVMAAFSFLGISAAFITDTFHQYAANNGGGNDTSYMAIALWVANVVILLDFLACAFYFHMGEIEAKPVQIAPPSYSVQVAQPQPFPQIENPAIQEVTTTKRQLPERTKFQGIANRARFKSVKVEPAKVVKPTEYTLENLLASAGMSREKAKSMLKDYGLTTPEKAYDTLKSFGKVPKGMTLEQARPLFQELFS